MNRVAMATVFRAYAATAATISNPTDRCLPAVKLTTDNIGGADENGVVMPSVEPVATACYTTSPRTEAGNAPTAICEDWH